MKIAVINGSPKGNAGNTNIITESFLRGAREGGAETITVFLAEKEITPCRGCHICWTRGPGQCVISDDMLQVLAVLGSADIIVFASPVYFANISGLLKTFMDRMTMIGGPQTAKTAKIENQKNESAGAKAPKLMMISSCGLSDRGEFDVISLWMSKVSQKMNMDFIGEIYATNGKAFSAERGTDHTAVSDYLEAAEQAGKEIATDKRISDSTRRLLTQPFPDGPLSN
ncbi:MAG: flavodoxin family protein [Eubacteriales bacterium]|nr:flavodoxin family protein [Eubacteriales bacterium]